MRFGNFANWTIKSKPDAFDDDTNATFGVGLLSRTEVGAQHCAFGGGVAILLKVDDRVIYFFARCM